MDNNNNNTNSKINTSMRKKSGKITKREEQSINKMIEELPDNPRLPVPPRNLTLKQRERLAIQFESVIREYLDCFMLIGYTPDGMRTFIVSADTPMQQDALNNLIADTTESYFNRHEMLKHGFAETPNAEYDDEDEDEDEDGY